MESKEIQELTKEQEQIIAEELAGLMKELIKIADRHAKELENRLNEKEDDE